MDIKKIKDQKGITGIDIVIAITIISITSIAIFVLYVNIVVNSKNVTRTSAATRVATSILENIDLMYYAEVEQELDRIIALDGVYKGDYSSSAIYDIFIPSKLQQKVFNTTLNSGYDVELVVNEISSPSNSDEYIPIANCPLVLEIRVIVKFDVSDRTQEITLKTIKKRELLQEANEPNLNDLLGTEFNIKRIDDNGNEFTEKRKIESLNQIQPIKWSTSTDSYIRTNKTDEWYSYLNKEWARVVITGVELDEDEKTVKAVFETNTDSVLNIVDQTIFVWIPRFGQTIAPSQEVGFTYGSSNDRILPITMRIGRVGSSGIESSIFKFNGIAKYDYAESEYEAYYSNGADDTSYFTNKQLWGKETLSVNSEIFPEGKSGIWIDITEGNLGGIIEDEESEKKAYYEKIKQYLDKTLNKSSYGPPITRIGSGENKYY